MSLKAPDALRWAAVLVLVLALMTLVLTPPAALAATPASPTIASAELLSLGQSEVGGEHAIDFWRVTLAGGEQVRFNVTQAGGQNYDLNLFAPGTTDATLPSLPPVSAGSTGGSSEAAVTLQAPYSGTFILAVCENAANSDCRNPGTKPMGQYSFTTTLPFGAIPVEAAANETRGAGSIAGSLPLKLQTLEAGGGGHIDFWQVALAGGERVRFNVAQAGGQNYDLNLFAPGTTDATLPSLPPVSAGSTGGSSEAAVMLQAPYSGTFILAVCENASNGDCRNPGQFPMGPYTFTTTLPFGAISVAAAAAETRAAGSIAAAAPLKLEALEAGGGGHIDFWRVTLAGGEQVRFSAAQAGGQNYDFNLFAPGTTDQSLPSLPPVASGSTGGSSEAAVTLQAPYSGTFILAVCENASNGDCRNPGQFPMGPYTFTTTITGRAAVSSPSGGGPAPPGPAGASVAFLRRSAKVTRSGVVELSLVCDGAACTGTFKLTARVRRTTRVGRRKKTTTHTLTIGVVSFSGLSIGAHTISVKLNRAGLRLLRQSGYRLNSAAKVTYTSGPASRTVSAEIALIGTKPKK